jgi:ribosomal protein S18 acetylase RimI-like enzyme
MHQPHATIGDPFRELEAYVHPHDPRQAERLLYVSDSCRAWRDESLLRCFSAAPPDRLLLLIHPELWLDGAIEDRFEYLHRVLLPRTAEPAVRYVAGDVARIWSSHPGPRAHDARLAVQRAAPAPADTNVAGGLQAVWADKAFVQSRLGALMELFRQFPELPWNEEQVLRDLPGKWENSLLLLRGEEIVGLSFNSLKDERLYIHALFVLPRLRRARIGARLVALVRERSRKLGARGVRLRVELTNRRALRFYRAMGFEISEVEALSATVSMDLNENAHGLDPSA